MRTSLRVIVIVFVASLIFGTTNLCWVYGGETLGGNLWDIVLDQHPFPGFL